MMSETTGCWDCEEPATTEDTWGRLTTPLCERCRQRRIKLREWLASD